MIIEKVEPFIKWPGGKRWFFKQYGHLLPQGVTRLIDPFLGGGASLFYLKPNEAVVSDVNQDLINTYQVMRNNYLELAELLLAYQKKHNSQYYYFIRDLYNPINEIDRAARFIYLNRMCYNGMYRVNKKGKFNVPIGTREKCTNDIDMFSIYSTYLQRAEIMTCDFSETLKTAREGDLIFADPPYAYSKANQKFNRYSNQLFSWNDQIRLCDELSEARNRNAAIYAMNAYDEKIIDLYRENGFYLVKVLRYSSVAGNPQNRIIQDELLISSNPQIDKWRIEN